MNIVQTISKLFPSQNIYAHCDVPCGMYTPEAAQLAAATLRKMVEKMNELSYPDQKNEEAVREYHNSMTRYILTKEEHARNCKREILILWTDYFKPEHLEAFPQLHELIWKAAKLCSQNKQHVSIDLAKQLVADVDAIAQIFRKTKQA